MGIHRAVNLRLASLTAIVSSVSGQVAIVLFPCLMIVASALDVMTMRISNRLVSLTVLMFFPMAVASGMPIWLMGLHFATGLLLLTLGFALFSLGLFGGGDGKLLAAAGLWLGFPCVLPFLLFTAAAGGVLAAAIGLWFMLSTEAGVRGGVLGKAFAPLRPELPYGFAIAAGAILTVPLTRWMTLASLQT